MNTNKFICGSHCEENLFRLIYLEHNLRGEKTILNTYKIIIKLSVSYQHLVITSQL